MIRKRISVFLAFILLFVTLRADVVWANTQNPVRDLTISGDPSFKGPGYKINLRWTPPLNPPVDPNEHPMNDKFTTFYEILNRNASKGQAFQASTDIVDDSAAASPGSPALNFQMTKALDAGALYVFRARPYHRHYVDVAGPNGTTTTQMSHVYPPDNSPNESLALFLTDITVTAKGQGGNLLVTWDNPRFDGTDIFSGFKIYYAEGGSNVGSGSNFPTTHSVDVPMNDPKLIKTATGQLQYAIVDSTLKVGVKYAVKVEPMYNNALLRLSSPPMSKVTIGAKEYPISYSTNEYRYNDASIDLSLVVIPEGSSKIKLQWNSIYTSGQTITKVEIFQSPDKFATRTSVGQLLGANAQGTNYWVTDRPTGVMYYQVEATVVGYATPIVSEIAIYDPTYNEFYPYSPMILELKPNVGATPGTPLNVGMVWEAFLRQPYNADEQKLVDPVYNNMFIDQNLTYKIWVSDNANNLASLNMDSALLSIPGYSLTPKPFVYTDQSGTTTTKAAYNTTLAQYYKKVIDPATNLETLVPAPITDNNVYFVKIIAERIPRGELSQEAFGSVFIPPTSDIPLNPQMISKPPLRIRGTSETAITIQWDLKWVEAFNAVDASWYSKIGVNASGGLVIGKDVDDVTKVDPGKILELNNPAFLDSTGLTYNAAAISAALTALGASGAEAAKIGSGIPLRIIDMKNAQYEIHVIDYDTLMKTTGTSALTPYERYLAILQDPTSDAMWKAIKPTGDPEHPEFRIESLLPNTTYVVYFRPFVMNQGKKTAYFPNFVIGTTLDRRTPVVIIPTVPALIAVSQTDMTATFKWATTPKLTYYISYSEKLTDYPDKGALVDWETISRTATTKNENGVDYIYYTLPNLFPDTMYHVWICSGVEDTVLVSAWSNPVSVKTNDISPPYPPGGLGPASKDDVTLYNKTNGTTYKPTDINSVIIEWLRDMNDLPPAPGPNPTAAPAPQPSPNPDSSVAMLLHPDLTSTYMAQFSKLIANKKYFVRGKTTMTVTKDANNLVSRSYGYTIEMSADEEFKDALTITYPAIPQAGQTGGNNTINPAYFKQKQSEWSTVIWVYTGTTTDEYDGDKNNLMYPLPMQDFEVTYDDKTDTLNVRFRTMGKDATGANDNGVDQRFISRLAASGAYTYPLDVSLYNNRPVKNSNVELPYSIIQALSERKIAVELTANNIKVSFTPNAFETQAVKGLANMGVGSNVKISLKESVPETPVLKQNDKYLSNPQKIAVSVSTPTRTVTLDNFAEPVKIDMKLNNRSAFIDNNVSAYIADGNTAGWKALSASYNDTEGTMSLNALKPANYSVVASGAPAQIEQQDPSREAFVFVNSKIKIKDMPTYTASASVSPNQLNQLIAAVANDRTEVSVFSSLSAADQSSLTKARLIVDPTATQKGGVTRQAAIDGLVKLYELKTRSQIKSYPTAEMTPYTDLAEADPKYVAGLLKASTLGFLGAGQAALPNEPITMGQMFEMLGVIISSAR